VIFQESYNRPNVKQCFWRNSNTLALYTSLCARHTTHFKGTVPVTPACFEKPSWLLNLPQPVRAWSVPAPTPVLQAPELPSPIATSTLIQVDPPNHGANLQHRRLRHTSVHVRASQSGSASPAALQLVAHLVADQAGAPTVTAADDQSTDNTGLFLEGCPMSQAMPKCLTRHTIVKSTAVSHATKPEEVPPGTECFSDGTEVRWQYTGRTLIHCVAKDLAEFLQKFTCWYKPSSFMHYLLTIDDSVCMHACMHA
jgi:hypothetical protein